MSIRQPGGGYKHDRKPIYLMNGQRAVVLVKEAWVKLAAFLDQADLDEDMSIIRTHILIQSGLIEEEVKERPPNPHSIITQVTDQPIIVEGS